jgi:hypothetical protein
MSRVITGHKVNPANDLLEIRADEKGHGGASHHYVIAVPDGLRHVLQFQNGPINEVGVNGITHEVLLAILIDRLQCFQEGPYSSRENAFALTKLEEAKHWLYARTLARMERGVEGTHAV